jgi:hypothetical protein
MPKTKTGCTDTHDEIFYGRFFRLFIILQERLRVLSGILILAVLVFVPFGYMGVPLWAQAVINTASGVAFFCWLPGLVIQRRMPFVAPLCLYSGLLLLVFGWGMTLNAKSIHDFDFWTFMPITQPFHWLPGSVDAPRAYGLMIRVSALFGVFIVCCDLCVQRHWVRWFILIISVVGTATAAFGIYQKVSPDRWDIWPAAQPPQNAFATFWYHGNAASFLNLVWPLLVGLAVRSFHKGHGQLLRALWLISMALVVVGLLLNVSKAGQAMAVLIAAAYFLMLIPKVPTIIAGHGWREPVMLAVLACAGLGALLYTLDWSPAIARWNQYLSSTGDSRLEVAGICLRLSADAGWFGFGPGAFDAVFQHYVSQHDLAQHGPGIGVRWVNAHNDYLQTLIDWGYMGTALWATFCFTPLRGAMGHVAAEIFPRARRRTFGQGKPSRLQRRDPLKVAVSLSILGVFVHAAYDFPLQIPGIEIYTAVLASLLSSSPHLK